MKKIKFSYLIVLSMILSLGACFKTKSFTAEISDLNGVWLPDWLSKDLSKLPEQEKEEDMRYYVFSWGEGKYIPYYTFEIDISANEPFFHATSNGDFYITNITQIDADSINAYACRGDPNDPYSWFANLIFHFIDKDTLWIETLNIEKTFVQQGNEYSKGALWHRLSGPVRQDKLTPDINQFKKTNITNEAVIDKENDTNILNGYINDNKVQIKSYPNINAETHGILNLGDIVTVIDIIEYKENYWYKIKTNDKTGWIFGEHIDLTDNKTPSEFVDAKWDDTYSNLYSADFSDLNGVWLPDWSYKDFSKLSEQEKEKSMRKNVFSWGEGKFIPYDTLNIDISAIEPFFSIRIIGLLKIISITQTDTNSIKINACQGDPDDPNSWSVNLILHFIDKDTLWIETKDIKESLVIGHEYGRDVFWHRISGPAQ
jgi:hypothetical protein